MRRRRLEDALAALDADGGEQVELTLAPPPPLAGWRRPDGGGDAVLDPARAEEGAARCERRRRARARARTGLTHAQVNAELNRLLGCPPRHRGHDRPARAAAACGNRWLVRPDARPTGDTRVHIPRRGTRPARSCAMLSARGAPSPGRCGLRPCRGRATACAWEGARVEHPHRQAIEPGDRPGRPARPTRPSGIVQALIERIGVHRERRRILACLECGLERMAGTDAGECPGSATSGGATRPSVTRARARCRCSCATCAEPGPTDRHGHAGPAGPPRSGGDVDRGRAGTIARTRDRAGRRLGRIPARAQRAPGVKRDGGMDAGTVARDGGHRDSVGGGRDRRDLGIRATGPVDRRRRLVAVAGRRARPDDAERPAAAGRERVGARGIRASAAWERTRGAPSVVVAVLDTGVATHDDLTGAIAPGRDRPRQRRRRAGRRQRPRDGGCRDRRGACRQRRRRRGRLSGVSDPPVKVAGADGGGTSAVLAEGIDHAVAHGADVINISLGLEGPSDDVRAAVERAIAAGVVVVAAAGNAAGTAPVYPAAYPGVIGVAATGLADQLQPWSRSGPWVTVTAPGAALAPLPSGRYGPKSGTSVASASTSRAPSASPSLSPLADLLLPCARRSTSPRHRRRRSTPPPRAQDRRPRAPLRARPRRRVAHGALAAAISGTPAESATSACTRSGATFRAASPSPTSGCALRAPRPGASRSRARRGSYAPTDADAGFRLVRRAVGTSPFGATEALSAPTPAVAAVSDPAATVVPAVAAAGDLGAALPHVSHVGRHAGEADA